MSSLIAGFEIITFVGRALLRMLRGFGSDRLAGYDLGRELLLTLLISLLVLSLLILSLQVRFRENCQLQIRALVAWGLARLSGFSSVYQSPSSRFASSGAPGCILACQPVH